MTHSIIFVPGKSPKPPPVIHREYLQRCLRRGVYRHDPDAVERVDACRFTLAAWNLLYYGRHEPLTADVPWIERLLEADGPSDEDIREARHWSKWLTRVMYALGDHAHWLIDWLPDPRVKAMIKDTLRYFDNAAGVAQRIRGVVKKEIGRACERGDSVCVAGHSMGAVIAYEALWQLTHEHDRPARVDLFLTLGSPLGMHYVQHRLLGFRDRPASYPAGIGKWINVSAVGDLVSVDERVADDFAPMLERGLTGAIEDVHRNVYTSFRNHGGLNPHRSYGYLAHPVVGGILARWLRNGSG